jgi:hypothetical protein
MKPYFADLSKTDAKKKAKAILASHDLHEEFNDSWLSDLYATYHYGCKKYQLRPERFKKTPHHIFSNSYQVECYFSSLGWKPASYLLCFENRDWRSRTITAFRHLTGAFMLRYLSNNPVCEKCGAPSQEVDHVDPEFSEIVSRALGLFPDSYWKDLHDDNHDWMNEGHYSLPENNPAVYYIQYLHQDGVIAVQALCKACHLLKPKGVAP